MDGPFPEFRVFRVPSFRPATAGPRRPSPLTDTVTALGSALTHDSALHLHLARCRIEDALLQLARCSDPVSSDQ